MDSLLDHLRIPANFFTEGCVVAVSGGADSVALLRLLCERRNRETDTGSVRRIWVAHLNHQLRGDASAADAEFVRELAKQLGLGYFEHSVNVAALAEHDRMNLEDTARRTRYQWLSELATHLKAGWVATGHTADDQAETVLHRLIRGTGIPGLRGIATQRDLQPGVRLIRPIIAIQRIEIMKYLNSLMQSWREDATNLDSAFTRNRIRHELLPLLETFNPAIRTSLNRLAEQAAEYDDELDLAADALLQETELPRAGNMVVLQAAPLDALPRSRVRLLFRRIWQREGWPQSNMSYQHWNRLVDGVLARSPGIDFPGGVHLRCRKEIVQLERTGN